MGCNVRTPRSNDRIQAATPTHLQNIRLPAQWMNYIIPIYFVLCVIVLLAKLQQFAHVTDHRVCINVHRRPVGDIVSVYLRVVCISIYLT
jgi:hypothetical protein